MQKYLYKSYEDDEETGEERYWTRTSDGGYWGGQKYAHRFTLEEIDDCNIHDYPPDNGEGFGRWVKDGIDVTLVGEVDPVYVGVYEVGRAYGGPEEGGWWFDCGELVKVVICSSYDEAEEVREILSEEYPNTGKRSSVLGGEDYGIYFSDTFPEAFFPERTPHYE
jgi:hypothetical protein